MISGFWHCAKLFAYDSYDDFDRPAVTWMHNGSEIGTYATEATYTFNDTVSIKEMHNAIGTSILNNEDYTRGIYIDGELLAGNYVSEVLNKETTDVLNDFVKITSNTTTVEGMLELLNNSDTTPFLESGAGVLTEVYIIPPEYTSSSTTGTSLVKEGQVIISMVHTYLAEISYITDNGDGDYTLDLRYYDGLTTELGTAGTSLNEDFVQNATIDTSKVEYKFDTTDTTLEKGQIVMVNMAENSNGKLVPVAVEKPQVVEGFASGSRLAPGAEGGSWLAVDGESYSYAHSMRGNLDETFIMAPEESVAITVYLDNNNLVLGYFAEVSPTQYLYVEDKDAGHQMSGSGAKVTFANGDEKVITVSKIDGYAITETSWSQVPSSNRYLDAKDNVATANENYAGFAVDDGYSKDLLANRIFGYNELSDGTYELITDIRQTPEDENDGGMLGGISVDTDGTTYYDTDYVGVPTDLYSTNRPATFDEDTMFIFSSVNYGQTTLTTDAHMFDLANEKYDTTNGYTWTYAIEKDVAAVSTMQTDYDGYKYSLDYDAVDGTGYQMDDISTNTKVGNHVFLVDNTTMFIDVVNNKQWQGFSGLESSMTDGDLNMQVVFGGNGVADVVFINHGAPNYDEGDYFIMLDNNADWNTVDGVTEYTYTIYTNEGVVDYIVSKDKQLVDSNNDALKNNHLYYITQQDDDYVYQVESKYSYSWYANDTYETSAYYGVGSTLGVNKPVSAASLASDGLIKTVRDEWFEDAAGGWYDFSTGDGVGVGEDVFSYDDDTKFVVLTANGVTSDNSSVKYSARPGSASDIITYSEGRTFSWVDIVAAENNDNKTTPKATFVVIIQPYVTDEVVNYSLLNYDVEVAARSGNGSEATPYVLEGYINMKGDAYNTDGTDRYTTYDYLTRIAYEWALDRGLDVNGGNFEIDIVKGTPGTSDWDDKEASGSVASPWSIHISGDAVSSNSMQYATDLDMWINVYFTDIYEGGTANYEAGRFTVVDTSYVVNWAVPFGVVSGTIPADYSTLEKGANSYLESGNTDLEGTTSAAPVLITGYVRPTTLALGENVSTSDLVQEIIRQYASDWNFSDIVPVQEGGSHTGDITEGGTNRWVMKATGTYKDGTSTSVIYYSVEFTDADSNVGGSTGKYVLVGYDAEAVVDPDNFNQTITIQTADGTEFDLFTGGAFTDEVMANVQYGDNLVDYINEFTADGSVFENVTDADLTNDWIVIVVDGVPTAVEGYAGLEALNLTFADIAGGSIYAGLTKADVADNFPSTGVTRAVGSNGNAAWGNLVDAGKVKVSYSGGNVALTDVNDGAAYYYAVDGAYYTIALDFSAGIPCMANGITVQFADTNATLLSYVETAGKFDVTVSGGKLTVKAKDGAAGTFTGTINIKVPMDTSNSTTELYGDVSGLSEALLAATAFEAAVAKMTDGLVFTADESEDDNVTAVVGAVTGMSSYGGTYTVTMSEITNGTATFTFTGVESQGDIAEVTVKVVPFTEITTVTYVENSITGKEGVAGSYFDPTGVRVTVVYNTEYAEIITYSATNKSDFTFEDEDGNNLFNTLLTVNDGMNITGTYKGVRFAIDDYVVNLKSDIKLSNEAATLDVTLSDEALDTSVYYQDTTVTSPTLSDLYTKLSGADEDDDLVGNSLSAALADAVHYVKIDKDGVASYIAAADVSKQTYVSGMFVTDSFYKVNATAPVVKDELDKAVAGVTVTQFLGGNDTTAVGASSYAQSGDSVTLKVAFSNFDATDTLTFENDDFDLTSASLVSNKLTGGKATIKDGELTFEITDGSGLDGYVLVTCEVGTPAASDLVAFTAVATKAPDDLNVTGKSSGVADVATVEGETKYEDGKITVTFDSEAFANHVWLGDEITLTNVDGVSIKDKGEVQDVTQDDNVFVIEVENTSETGSDVDVTVTIPLVRKASALAIRVGGTDYNDPASSEGVKVGDVLTAYRKDGATSLVNADKITWYTVDNDGVYTELQAEVAGDAAAAAYTVTDDEVGKTIVAVVDVGGTGNAIVMNGTASAAVAANTGLVVGLGSLSVNGFVLDENDNGGANNDNTYVTVSGGNSTMDKITISSANSTTSGSASSSADAGGQIDSDGNGNVKLAVTGDASAGYEIVLTIYNETTALDNTQLNRLVAYEIKTFLASEDTDATLKADLANLAIQFTGISLNDTKTADGGVVVTETSLKSYDTYTGE